MRAELVIPRGVARQFSTHFVDVHGHKNAASAFVLHGSNEPFDDGNGSVFTHGAVSNPYLLSLRPFPESIAIELCTPVTDDVLGVAASSSHGPAKEPANFE